MVQTNTKRAAASKILALGLLLATFTTASLMLTTRPAQAADFTVTNTNDSGTGSLRQAILNANNTPGADAINFNIGGSSGVKTIKPASQLPVIRDTVSIDGYTQSGSLKNTEKGLGKTNAKPLIELDGTNAGSGSSGLVTRSGASDSAIKGLVINRFGVDGIQIISDPVGPELTGVEIEGNFIGTDAIGRGDLGNRFGGVVLNDGENNTIGGAAPEARNLISGNNRNGVFIISSAVNHKVEGNLIGTKKDGASDLGNTGDGVGISSSSFKNTVGGAEPGVANTIAFNDENGVEVEGSSTGSRIFGNSIFSNDRLAINLAGGNQDADGRTSNDAGDVDSGPNNLQNFPVLSSAKISKKGRTNVKGALNSAPNETFTVQIFSNPKGEDEGKKFIGQRSVTTDGSGNASFSLRTRKVGKGESITATATDPNGNTSEFSAPRLARSS